MALSNKSLHRYTNPMRLPKQLTTIPQKPGVYIFKDKAGGILYIGKARNLKPRVRSYFQQSQELSPTKQIMVGKIKKIEYIIVSSEAEALLLESNLIQKHQPTYNVDLKDDKFFLYIKVAVQEDYPRVFTVRRVVNDGSRYFGPYVSAGATRKTLWLLRKLFPHRNFSKPPTKHEEAYLMRRYPELLGPTDKRVYRKTIEHIIRFLEGQYEDLLKDLRLQMQGASKKREFERAAKLRDHIFAIEKIMQEQKVISVKKENEDIISLARGTNVAAVNLFMVRNGKLMQRFNVLMKNAEGQTDEEILRAFVERYYLHAQDLPKTVVVPAEWSERPVTKHPMRFIAPTRGKKRKLLRLGEENAQSFLNEQRASWEKKEVKAQKALKELQTVLHLDTLPVRIEAFDISNVQGQYPVGSMVVFENGLPAKKWYRKFHIKTVRGSNDTAMMAEMLHRRFGRIVQGDSKWPRPDLVLLDGGKGQLNVAREAVGKRAGRIPFMALAKRLEDIYVPGKKQPVNLPRGSEGLFLIQRMRDEAHRFAIGFYRKKHMHSSERSQLDSIPGLGTKRKQALIRTFGSVAAIREATSEELTNVIGAAMARRLQKELTS